MSVVLERIVQSEADAELGRKALYGEVKLDADGNPIDETDLDTEDAEKLAAEAKAKEEAEKKQKEDESYKAKYDTLQGKYNKELPNALASAKTAQQEADHWRGIATGLQSDVVELKAKIKELETRKPAETETDEELEEFEADNPALVKLLKKEREKSAAEIKTLKDKLENVSTEVKSSHELTGKSAFKARMKELVGDDWATIDVEPAFEAWLKAEKVPLTPYTRWQLLQKAASEFDADLVAPHFLDYKKTLGTTGEADDDTQKAVDETKPDKHEKHIAPPSGPAGGIPKAGAGADAGFTLEDYRAFMDQTTRGKWRKNDPRWKGKNEEQLEAIFNKKIADRTLV